MKCEDCKFFKRDYSGWRGSCDIKLPPPFMYLIDHITVGRQQECDLGQAREPDAPEEGDKA